MKLQKVFLSALLLVGFVATTAKAASDEKWSGHWVQNNQRSIPTRSNSYSFQMDLELKGSRLQIHNRVNSGHGADRKLDVAYEIGGQEVVYTGTDGDEFHAKARWVGEELVFSIVEHERGKLIPFTETWTLIDGGKSLQRVKIDDDPKQKHRAVSILEK